MRTFLYLNLAASARFVNYEQPDLKLVRANFPAVAVLDIDSASDEMLLHYAKRMMLEARQTVLCIKAGEDAAFQNLLPLLEGLLEAEGQKLVLLRGNNPRLQRILQARPQLPAMQVETEAKLLKELRIYFD